MPHIDHMTTSDAAPEFIHNVAKLIVSNVNKNHLHMQVELQFESLMQKDQDMGHMFVNLKLNSRNEKISTTYNVLS